MELLETLLLDYEKLMDEEENKSNKEWEEVLILAKKRFECIKNLYITKISKWKTKWLFFKEYFIETKELEIAYLREYTRVNIRVYLHRKLSDIECVNSWTYSLDDLKNDEEFKKKSEYFVKTLTEKAKNLGCRKQRN